MDENALLEMNRLTALLNDVFVEENPDPRLALVALAKLMAAISVEMSVTEENGVDRKVLNEVIEMGTTFIHQAAEHFAQTSLQGDDNCTFN